MTLKEYLESYDREYLGEGIGENIKNKIKSGFKKIKKNASKVLLGTALAASLLANPTAAHARFNDQIDVERTVRNLENKDLDKEEIANMLFYYLSELEEYLIHTNYKNNAEIDSIMNKIEEYVKNKITEINKIHNNRMVAETTREEQIVKAFKQLDNEIYNYLKNEGIDAEHLILREKDLYNQLFNTHYVVDTPAEHKYYNSPSIIISDSKGSPDAIIIDGDKINCNTKSIQAIIRQASQELRRQGMLTVKIRGDLPEDKIKILNTALSNLGFKEGSLNRGNWVFYREH